MLLFFLYFDNHLIKFSHFLLIDDGKNPDEFIRDVLNSCIAKNQITKSKTDAFKGLQGNLLEELEKAFPEEVEAYKDIRAAFAAKAKRLAQAQSLLPTCDLRRLMSLRIKLVLLNIVLILSFKDL
ncbi:hypothetical protein P3L10_028671 [Capsicum annuum]